MCSDDGYQRVSVTQPVHINERARAGAGTVNVTIMEGSPQDSPYVNITSSNLEYEEVELRERKDGAEKIQVEQGSQIALTSATPQKVYRVKQDSHDYEIPSVAAADRTHKHLVILVVILGFVSIVALVLSLLVITGVVGPKISRETKGNW